MRQQTRFLSMDDGTEVARSAHRELVFEHDGKSLLQSDKPDLLIQEFRSSEAAGNKTQQKTRSLDYIRNEMSCYLFEYLEGFHIPTFFVEKLSPLRMMVKRIEPIPLYVKIFNTGRGVFSGRFGIKQDISLDFPIIEHYYKNGTENSSWVNEYHVHALDIATPEEFKQINRIASKINAVLRGLCDRRQLVLADSQLKFGRWKGQIVLGDELSPTTCHFLDLARGETSQRDRFQVGQEAGEEAWGELCDRLMSKV